MHVRTCVLGVKPLLHLYVNGSCGVCTGSGPVRCFDHKTPFLTTLLFLISNTFLFEQIFIIYKKANQKTLVYSMALLYAAI